MAKTSFNAAHKKILDTLLLSIPGVTVGMMFGYPAYYVDGKMFACLYGEGVGIKVPEDVANALLGRNEVVPFQPMGRSRMREWVQINRPVSADYRLDREAFQRAVEFCGKRGRK